MKVTQPNDLEMLALCDELAKFANTELDFDDWPLRQLQLCADAGVFDWFISKSHGGIEWTSEQIVDGYLQLASASLTTTFILTQLTGACRRISAAENPDLPQRLLPCLLSGESFATLGISHLSTSRRHLKRPVLRAVETERGFLLNGFSPWVTGGGQADYIVTGASFEDGRQLLAVVPTELEGVRSRAPAELVALNGSCTAAVDFYDVEVEADALLCQPTENVMQQAVGGNTGGVQTSTLAVGLAKSAIEFLKQQAQDREDLRQPAEQLDAEAGRLVTRLKLLVADKAPSETAGRLRADANSLVLRATQAALVAAKGAGYVVGHPAGRWCQEALFFLVWSCPQTVLHANLCELAGLQD